ncbi:MAG: cell division protein FtsZ, partial [Bacteroidota bacterium]
MGSGTASGEGRAMAAVREALESPLLNDNDITGANFVLLNITYGMDEVLMDEIMEITDHIQEMAGMSAEVIWGYGPDESLEEDLCVTVIATGFQANEIDAGLQKQEPKTKKLWLGDQSAKQILAPVNKPTDVAENKQPLTFEDTVQEEPYIKTEESASVETEPMVSDDEIAPLETPIENLDQTPELPQESPEIVVHTLEEEAPNLFDIKAEETSQQPEPEPERDPEPEINKMKFEEKKPEAGEPVYFELGSDDEDNFPPDNAAEITDKLSFSDQIERAEEKAEDRPSRSELVAKNKDREQRIREYTVRLKTPSGLSDLESEPAFKRRAVELDNVKHSSESDVSRFTLSEETDENGNKKTQLRDNNPFLHDNVD